MRKLGIVILAVLIVFGAARSPLFGIPLSASDQKTDALASRIDALLTKTYPPDKPGAVGLVVQNGKVLFRKAYGMADLELGVPMAPDMVFPCGSMTKMFTATAVMMLAEAGALKYEDPIAKYIPDAPAAWAGLTIDHLLSHTSGLLDLFRIPAWMAQWKEEISPRALTAFFKDKPLQFEPGTKAEYCNSNYVLLAQAVENISGKPIEQFVKERMITPLGLKTTWFVVKHEDLILRRIGGYLISPDGSLKNTPFLIPWSQAYGVGTVHSTVDEISKFVAALFDGTLLKPESAARVTTPRLMKDGKPAPYGYGNLFVFTEGLAPLVRISGSTSTTQVYSLYAPEEKAFVAVFSSLSTHFPNTPNPYFPGPPAKEIALMLAGKK